MAASIWAPGTSIEVINANQTLIPQAFTATVGQTIFNLTAFVYTLGVGSLLVFKNGAALRTGTDFTETSTTRFTLAVAANAGDIIYAIGFVGITGAANTASILFNHGTAYATGTIGSKLKKLIDPCDSPYNAVGDGVADDTAAIRAAIVAFNASGGILTFQGRTYNIFPGTHIVDPSALGVFTNLIGAKIDFAGAKFVCSGDITVDAVRMTMFEFTGCINTEVGDFTVDYTGVRNVGGANTATAMYRRGLTALKFKQNNIGVRLGNMKVSKCGLGVWFSNTGDYTLGTRIVTGGSINAFQTGYPVQGDESPHIWSNFTIYAEECGRILKMQNVYNHRNIIAISKNHDSGENLGYTADTATSAAILENIDIDYTDRSTLSGRAIGVMIPLALPTVTIKNINIKAAAVVLGAADLQHLVKIGLSTGSVAAGVDFKIDGLTLDVVIDAGGANTPANTQGLRVEFPAGWGVGANIRNFKVKRYSHIGAGSTNLDMRGIADAAVFENVNTTAEINQTGNTVGTIYNNDCNVSEFCATSDTSKVVYKNCIVRQDSAFSPKQAFDSNKVFINTKVGGVVYNSNPGAGKNRFLTAPIIAAYGASGTAVNHVAGTLYAAEVIVPRDITAVGIAILNGGTVGTSLRIAAIYKPNDTTITLAKVLANSALAGTVSVGANAFQLIPFTASKFLPAGRYIIVVQANNNTDNIRCIAVNTAIDAFTISQAGVFATLADLNPMPTAVVADVGPIAYVYAS